MHIEELVWNEEQIEHIARHGVLPQEVKEVCSNRPQAFRRKTLGKNPVYELLGQTDEGRYLTCFVIRFPDGRAYPVTARPMTEKERRRYNRSKK